ncbi:MAG: AAA family ATPase, partial [Chroococcales cyanobacterium]
EIEKAHPRVLDKFLQILEDGRLTDGKGRTAYFNQTVIVFTSNIGASDLTDPQTGALLRSGIMTQVQQQGTELFSYEQVNQHFREEVRWYFSSRIGRAELLNRFGDNIVVFDLLRPEFVSQIGDKFLGQLRDSAAQKYGLMLQFDESVMNILTAQMQQGENLLFGGRRVKTMLESWVERPLNRWLFQEYGELSSLRGSQLQVGLTDFGELRVVRETPG